MRTWSTPKGTRPKILQKQKENSLIPWPDKDQGGADMDPRTQAGELDKEGLDIKAETKNSLGGSHVFYKTQYWSDDLLGMNTKVSSVDGTQGEQQQTIQALADSGASAFINSWDLAKNINMIIYEKGDATLKDGSHNHMYVSGKGEVIVQEDDGLPLKIKVLVSKDLGKDELVVGLEGPEHTPQRLSEDSS